jgi:hypothetical protein
MKRWKRCLSLLLCLLLTACSRNVPDQKKAESALEKASGLEETAVLMTVNGQDVPAWRYLYWLVWTCDQLQQCHAESGAALDWDAPVSGGTLAQYAKEQALADTALYAVVEQLAQEAGYAPAGEQETDAALPELGFSPEQLVQLEAVGQMYGWLYEQYCEGRGPLVPTEEELEAYEASGAFVTLDRILISAGEDREAARHRAAEWFSRLNSADDQAAVFSALAAEGGDRQGPRTLRRDDGTLPAELLAAAQDLQPDQCSGILETQEGFSILRRMETPPDALRELYFDDALLSLAETAEIAAAPAYGALDPAAFYQAWMQERRGL